ncbi:hypothetical protein A0U90_12640 [Kozakia baliensis]|nr:hypothetical protein A0U90_12640 [Kozakia baliensis]
MLAMRCKQGGAGNGLHKEIGLEMPGIKPRMVNCVRFYKKLSHQDWSGSVRGAGMMGVVRQNHTLSRHMELTRNIIVAWHEM